MNYSDLINGIFEFIGAIFVCLSIYKLNKDKEVKGVHWLPIMFFTLWGGFNVWFYPHNDLYYSFIGGLFLMIINSIWVIQLIYYGRKR